MFLGTNFGADRETFHYGSVWSLSVNAEAGSRNFYSQPCFFIGEFTLISVRAAGMSAMSTIFSFQTLEPTVPGVTIFGKRLQAICSGRVFSMP